MEPKYIELKLYGETVATVIVLPSWTRNFTITKNYWTRDEALVLADFIQQNLAGPVSFVDSAV